MAKRNNSSNILSGKNLLWASAGVAVLIVLGKGACSSGGGEAPPSTASSTPHPSGTAKPSASPHGGTQAGNNPATRINFQTELLGNGYAVEAGSCGDGTGDQGGKPVRPSELGVRLALTRATITYRVDRLLDLGLAERTADPADRRALFVRLTPKGEEVLGAVMTRYAATAEQKLVDIDDMGGGRAALEASLMAIARRFDNEWPMDPGKLQPHEADAVDHLAGEDA